ncbi:MAG: HAD hydrolase family protein [Phycisphaerae bacterium]|nr:HAD hydrolase family protein [Phycisphaerae bacterium]
MDFGSINVLILDVDGVLTDGRLRFGPDGEDVKMFHAQDGYAIRLWQRAGYQTAILSGRRHPAVERRAAELGIACVRQGEGKKGEGYRAVCESLGASDAHVCYVGDDLPDLAPMMRCAFPVAVANAVPAVKTVARYVTDRGGGEGAVAEVVELVLRKQHRWLRELWE